MPELVAGPGSSPKELKFLADKKLLESGLNDKHAKALKFSVLTAAEVKALGFDNRPALKIPYFNPDGSLSDFYRLRYLGAPTGFAAGAVKPHRYVQLPGSLNEVYLPPLLERSWTEILADPKVPIYITEGEFKAAAAASRGIACIGLGGVDCFRASKKGYDELLPTLLETNWAQRETHIVWDSDVGTKEGAQLAQRKLAHELIQRGGIPRLIALPPGENGAKVGLDDYLLDHTPDELLDLFQNVEPFSGVKELWKLNELVAFIEHPSIVLEKKSGNFLNPHFFMKYNYATHRYKTIDEKGKAKMVSAPEVWMQWPQREQYESITYAPGEPKVHGRKWNTWNGWGVESKYGSVAPWKELLDLLFEEAEPGAREWFEKWCAYPLQHPGTKLFSAAVIWGVYHGTGKTLVGYTLKDIYGENASVIGDAQLHASFNEWAHNKQFVVGEEITGSDKRTDSSRLKALITQEHISINLKYLPAITVPDCINYFFTSNAPNAFFLEDTDRRFFVHEVIGGPAPASFYKMYDTWRKEGGAAHLRYYLEHLDLTGFNPKQPALTTTSKREMITDNRSEMSRWVHELKDNPDRVLQGLGNALAAEKCDVLTPTQILHLFNPSGDPHKGTANGLSREMKAAGFRKPNAGIPIMTKLGAQRFWLVRNTNRWINVEPAVIAEHWESFWCVGRKF